jgi:hypothetical protein
MNLELEIRELVLDGFPAADRDRIARAVHKELERLFSERGVPISLQGGGDVARIDGGSFQVAPNSSPEATGTQVARALYGGMSE